jgi:SAM-dependent methyltransferase
MDMAEVARWLAWGRARRIGHLWLGGGEPTLRPDLTRIVRAARRVGYWDVLLQTNGLRLAYAAYAEAVVAAGVDTVSLNIKSVDPAVHDRLSGLVGAHRLAMRAIEELRRLPVRIVADLLLARSTLPTLAQTVRDLARRGVGRIWLWTLSAADLDRPEVRAEVPDPRSIALALEGAARAADEMRVGLRSLHTPPCTLPPGLRALYGSAAELDLWVANPGQGEPMPLSASAMEGGAWLEGCEGCAARSLCGGPRRDMLEIHGREAFVPIPRRVSNAFHYVLSGAPVAWPAGAPCPLVAGPPDPAPHRSLHLRDAAGVTRAETGTQDFDQAAIARVKDELGQLYLDTSDKDAPDDFPRDLRLLIEDPACGECPVRSGCGRAFRVSPQDVFSRDDEAVREKVSRLAGEVLDIGAGKGRYLDILAPLAASGAIRYRAVEPDVASAEVLHARAPWAEVQVTAAEDLVAPEQGLDHVMILRSYNHLEDPRAVLARVVRALRPGGRLLVVDNLAFALVRTRAQADRAEASRAGFEHLRNDGVAELLAVLEGLPLEVVEVRAVASGTSNQWLVEAVAVAAVREH